MVQHWFRHNAQIAHDSATLQEGLSAAEQWLISSNGPRRNIIEIGCGAIPRRQRAMFPRATGDPPGEGAVHRRDCLPAMCNASIPISRQYRTHFDPTLASLLGYTE
jgi:hypothetical protein